MSLLLPADLMRTFGPQPFFLLAGGALCKKGVQALLDLGFHILNSHLPCLPGYTTSIANTWLASIQRNDVFFGPVISRTSSRPGVKFSEVTATTSGAAGLSPAIAIAQQYHYGITRRSLGQQPNCNRSIIIRTHFSRSRSGFIRLSRWLLILSIPRFLIVYSHAGYRLPAVILLLLKVLRQCRIPLPRHSLHHTSLLCLLIVRNKSKPHHISGASPSVGISSTSSNASCVSIIREAYSRGKAGGVWQPSWGRK
ncbi:uncharacterized protein LAJ45_01163 [Morchella importuna]|uniref:uncharacterized protein n=1 Tax=Morchella importuna TaxID=1174673 RepID=UPI001E8D38E7|nr:uncharacterized protein LAJ45_01163 [Morchella importuna]KAH8154635.1 hypothetical protein LAJ45_01163 [Morchella importuna]